ncbi:UDP-2,3-diacylglucosamine diphosphatase [Chromatium okenii]|uniref:UDP-2,3-diacylglucosamine diphosphatase n=1 Tax=Chromatium okenii TaxID=61644 RepID=UPI0026EE6FD7|nr:UDP-2,3-diacylglucosamine diphosphatase [Chromatium okenii]MBV5310991.1 UDP-2,3-diacylglucosamine diphosphatase [Chromatium okenii]
MHCSPTDILLIADVHLSPEYPATVARFVRFLSDRARQAQRLYILGDLFDAWIGDDDDAPHNVLVSTALRDLTAAGVECVLLHGNRDFLLGRRFFRHTGCRLGREPLLIDCAGERTLLLHGDVLCTDDVAYQRFRRRVRNPLLQQLFLWKSLARRREIADHYRRTSMNVNTHKAPAIMDVNPLTVNDFLRRFAATRLIHGHTHRPDEHVLDLDGKPARRSVLAQWDEMTGGEVLVFAPQTGEWRREPVL